MAVRCAPSPPVCDAYFAGRTRRRTQYLNRNTCFGVGMLYGEEPVTNVTMLYVADGATELQYRTRRPLQMCRSVRRRRLSRLTFGARVRCAGLVRRSAHLCGFQRVPGRVDSRR